MKITMRVTAAGPAGVKLAGRTYDVPEAEAKGLLSGGYAGIAAAAAKVAPAAPAPAAKPAAGKDYVPAPETEDEKEKAPAAPPSAPKRR